MALPCYYSSYRTVILYQLRLTLLDSIKSSLYKLHECEILNTWQKANSVC